MKSEMKILRFYLMGHKCARQSVQTVDVTQFKKEIFENFVMLHGGNVTAAYSCDGHAPY